MDVDSESLNAFKTRMLGRLQLAQSAMDILENEKNTAVELLRRHGKELLKPQEVENICNDIAQVVDLNTSDIENAIADLCQITESTWQGLYEFQERYLRFLMLSFEQPLILHRELCKAFSLLLEVGSQRLKRTSKNQNRNVKQPKSPETYSTPELDVMKKAIEKFWVGYDKNKPPLQKEVSFFIAESLGESDKNRLTDTLATVIQPLPLRKK